jgi:hypothetical protein
MSMRARAWGGALVLSAVIGLAACGAEILGGGGAGGSGGAGATGSGTSSSPLVTSSNATTSSTSGTTSISSNVSTTGGNIISSNDATTGGGDECWDLSDCSQCPDGGTCVDCCSDPNNPTTGAAYAELISDIVFECACVDANAACNSICTMPGVDLCNGESPDQDCIDCIQNELDNQAQCLQDGIDDCNVSATCQPIFECFQSCP